MEPSVVCCDLFAKVCVDNVTCVCLTLDAPLAIEPLLDVTEELYCSIA